MSVGEGEEKGLDGLAVTTAGGLAGPGDCSLARFGATVVELVGDTG